MKKTEYIFIVWQKEPGFFGQDLVSVWDDEEKATSKVEKYRLINKEYRFWLQKIKISS